jgi:hypothetical protein
MSNGADNLMKSLLAKLYQILTGGDENAQPSKDSFVVWCAPGLAFQPEDLAFAAQGPLGGKDATEARLNLSRAADFSRLMNLVPSAAGICDAAGQKAIYEQQGTSIWDVYRNVLQYSEVGADELTADQQKKLEKFQGLLRKTIEKKDLVTDEVTRVTVDGDVLAAYNRMYGEYLIATTDYNNKRISALNADDPLMVQDWALNASNYRQRVKSAYDAWVSGGYKNDVDQMNAYIDQVTSRSLLLLKSQLKDRFDRSKLTDLSNGQDFYYTSFVPVNFATGKGWTTFTFSEKNEQTYSRNETNAWKADLGITKGAFTASASTTGSIATTAAQVDTSGFSMKCDIAQVALSRPWFAPEFLRNSAWRFIAGRGMSALSDGNRPPNGQMVAYATGAVFVRALKVDFAELHKSDSTYAQAISAKANVGIGPFNLSGGYDRSVGERKAASRLSESGLEVPGMQLIALKCAIVPKAPNPSSDITKWE